MGLFGNDSAPEIADLRMRVSQLEERVEQLAQLLDAPEPPRDTRMDEVLRLTQAGRQIEAIKALRELQPGLGLAEAKALVDAM
ncbi:ribosomal protein L7/L12 [Ornithinimicrobium cryptoxanthini]|uniref:Ribosomal protein L7/L12 n=1 Tax=Ornithinimicrobium cryptoxanthini TaxID=2934161 RepID=A0ABY4YIN3_9MICO|nr:ribosomal protein L7/L12 [Ornithinimicrobium cryptoxanthini]USQ76487.1 ribosomal protein L7/L12 [Ornithinimicrobium cryptoxanthini]